MNATEKDIPIIKADKLGIFKAAGWIRQGKVIAFPTETLYGLAVDALNPMALSRLMSIKQRDPIQTVSVLVSDQKMLFQLVANLSEVAQQLIDTYWPGPLTLILPALSGLPLQIVSSKGGVGVRISSDSIANALIKEVGGPITCTSANTSGAFPATTALAAKILGLKAVLDDGPREQRASTIIDLLNSASSFLKRQFLSFT